MAIRFACAKCQKTFRLDDGQAGRVGKCGRCGHRFAVPGSPKPPPRASVFVPASPIRPPATKRPRSPQKFGKRPFAIVAAVAVLAGSAAAYFQETALGTLSLVLGVPFAALMWAGLLLPLWLPGYLSRRGKLSIARWSIFAVLFLFLGAIGVWLGDVAANHDRDFGTRTVDPYLVWAAYAGMGIVGCLIAAAIHPKAPAKSP